MPDGTQFWRMIDSADETAGRISQACDRCRCKKIKCDGKRPHCTPCVSVGFECRVSDKLSRRAFPRGYTESLEYRVRELEAALQETRIISGVAEHDGSSGSATAAKANQTRDQSPGTHRDRHRSSSANSDDSASQTTNTKSASPQPKDKSLAKPTSQEDGDVATSADASDAQDQEPQWNVHHAIEMAADSSCYVGPSSGYEIYARLSKRIFHDYGSKISVEKYMIPTAASRKISMWQSERREIPPRSIADELVSQYFNTWNAMLPILHRPTFMAKFNAFYGTAELNAPEVSTSGLVPGSVPNSLNEDSAWMAQLLLVMAIGTLQVDETSRAESESLHCRAHLHIQAIRDKTTLETLQVSLLQCLVLTASNRTARLYRTISDAATMCRELGLHLPQTKKPVRRKGPLDTEMRRRLFWICVTLDTFITASQGHSQNFSERELHVPYPSDIDDEYITATKFLAPQPGSPTTISYSLSIFRAAKVLWTILYRLYRSNQPVGPSVIGTLLDSLEVWRRHLPYLCKFEIPERETNEANDTFIEHLLSSSSKQSMATVNRRKTTLALIWNYIRRLVYSVIVASHPDQKSSIYRRSVIAIGQSSITIMGLMKKAREMEDGTNGAWCFLLSESGLGYQSTAFAAFADLHLVARDNTDRSETAGKYVEFTLEDCGLSHEAFSKTKLRLLEAVAFTIPRQQELSRHGEFIAPRAKVMRDLLQFQLQQHKNQPKLSKKHLAAAEDAANNMTAMKTEQAGKIRNGVRVKDESTCPKRPLSPSARNSTNQRNGSISARRRSSVLQTPAEELRQQAMQDNDQFYDAVFEDTTEDGNSGGSKLMGHAFENAIFMPMAGERLGYDGQCGHGNLNFSPRDPAAALMAHNGIIASRQSASFSSRASEPVTTANTDSAGFSVANVMSGLIPYKFVYATDGTPYPCEWSATTENGNVSQPQNRNLNAHAIIPTDMKLAAPVSSACHSTNVAAISEQHDLAGNSGGTGVVPMHIEEGDMHPPPPPSTISTSDQYLSSPSLSTAATISWGPDQTPSDDPAHMANTIKHEEIFTDHVEFAAREANVDEGDFECYLRSPGGVMSAEGCLPYTQFSANATTDAAMQNPGQPIAPLTVHGA